MGGRVDSPAEGDPVIAASMDGVGVLEDGVFVRANEELASSFGYENSDALVGVSWTELYPGGERKRIESEILPQVRDERRWRGTSTGVRVDGAAVPQVLSIYRSGDGRLVWVVRDRSGSVEHDPIPGPMTRSGSDAVRNGGEKLEPEDDWADGERPAEAESLETGSHGIGVESLVETAPVPILVITTDRGIVYSNRKAVELLGAEDRNELHGHGPERFVHPESREQVRQRIRHVIEDRGATEPREYRLLGLDGRERFGEVTAAPVTYGADPGAYVVINDITPKRSQADPRGERRFIRAVIDALDDILYVVDEDGRPHLWNEALLETTGYTHDEIDTMDPRELIPGDHHEHISDLREALDATEDRRVEIDILTQDGERIPHEFQGTTFEDPETGGVFYCGVARDITERLEREQELERYETIVEAVGDGVYALDEDLRFSFVNDALCELLELPREELLGTSVTGLMMERGYDEEVEAHEAVRERVVEGETDVGTVQTPKPGSDGDQILEARYRLYPESHEEYRGSVGVIRDITERQEREEKVRRQRSLIRGILDTVPDAIFAYDEAGKPVLEEALPDEFVGYSGEELAEMELVDFLPEGDRAEVQEHLQRVLEAGETVTFEADIVTEAGRPIPHEFRAAPLELDGELLGVAAAARDITERLERERELERYETFIETVNDGVYALDEDLRFSFVNEALCEMADIPREEFLGLPIGDLPVVNDEELEIAEEIRKRVVEDDTSTGTVQLTLSTSDGDRVLEANYRLYPEPDGEYRGSIGVIRDVTDREAREQQLRRQRTLIRGILNTVPDAIFAYDEAGEPILEESLLEELAGYSGEELAGIELTDFLPEEDRATARDHLQQVLEAGETVTFETDIVTEAGRPIPHEFRAAPLELEGGPRGIAAAARDITERRRRERKLERQRDELATLDRINELLLETARELIQTSSREAVERAVCEQLTASALYQFAWVGEEELEGDRIVPRTSAGEDGGYLDAVTITADDSATGQGPVGRAIRTGEIQVVNVDDPSFEPWREPATERGFESVAAVPLRHGETVYGVLVVYATREDAFSEREQAGFDVLGRTVGFVIHAARSRELLFTDAVAELELDVGDNTRFVRTAADLDCELSLDGYVASKEGWVQYLTVTDALPEVVAEAMAADPLVDRVRVVSEESDGGRIELVVAESSLLHTVTAAGATVRTVEADADGGRIVVEAPLDADIRGIVDRIQSQYPGTRLVAHRERDREVTTVGRPGGLLDELTDRQREVLEAAYRAGYFTWPRESTAEEVAESLGLASATLHGHLRKAEGVILSTLLDEE